MGSSFAAESEANIELGEKKDIVKLTKGEEEMKVSINHEKAGDQKANDNEETIITTKFGMI